MSTCSSGRGVTAVLGTSTRAVVLPKGGIRLFSGGRAPTAAPGIEGLFEVLATEATQTKLYGLSQTDALVILPTMGLEVIGRAPSKTSLSTYSVEIGPFHCSRLRVWYECSLIYLVVTTVPL